MQDRSWRLLENREQVECDVYSAAGAVARAARGRRTGWRVVGRAGAGGVGRLIGVGAYMGWRYGVGRGKWEMMPEKVTKEVNPAVPVGGKRKEKEVTLSKR